MHRSYIHIDKPRPILTKQEFAAQPDVHSKLLFAYDDDTYSDYNYLLQSLYSQYITPQLNGINHYKFISPIIDCPRSMILHLLCINSISELIITIYNDDKYPIKNIIVTGEDLMTSWKDGYSNICFDLIEYLKQGHSLVHEAKLYISFVVKGGFILSENVLLEY
jgi:hypothetical protein